MPPQSAGRKIRCLSTSQSHGSDYEWYVSVFFLGLSDAHSHRQGGEKYQSAFYVYEELASNPNSTAPLSIVGQAIAELHLGRFPEAEAALTAALEKYPEDVELIANTIVLNVLTGKDTTELTSYVPRFNRLGYMVLANT